MYNIGNDIVDLNLAKSQSNWQRKGFLEKQFTEDEQKIIFNSENPFLQVWLFWSMKEAAYKCYTQEHKQRFFAPKKFSCKILSESIGVVDFNQKKYTIKYIFTIDYVYAVAQEKVSKKMVSELFFIHKIGGEFQNKNQKLLSYLGTGIELKKNGIGIPYAYQQGKRLPISISTSHHGNYGAFAISYS